ncbi:MAG: hypothetical protein EOP04_25210, partial [Proteobacteria bacterium]
MPTPGATDFCDVMRELNVVRSAKSTIDRDITCGDSPKKSIAEVRYCDIKSERVRSSEEKAAVERVLSEVESNTVSDATFVAVCSGSRNSQVSTIGAACRLAEKSRELAYLTCVATGNTSCKSPGTNNFGDMEAEIRKTFEENSDLKGLVNDINALAVDVAATAHDIEVHNPAGAHYKTVRPSLFKREYRPVEFIEERGIRHLELDGYRCSPEGDSEEYDAVSASLEEAPVRLGMTPRRHNRKWLYDSKSMNCFLSEEFSEILKTHEQKICKTVHRISPTYGAIVESNVCQPISEAIGALRIVPVNQRRVGYKTFAAVLGAYPTILDSGDNLAKRSRKAHTELLALGVNGTLIEKETQIKLNLIQGRINALKTTNLTEVQSQRASLDVGLENTERQLK